MEKLKIGLFGLGHLGIIHLTKLKEFVKVQIQGIYDVELEKALNISTEYDVKRYGNPETLIMDCDCLVIAAPTTEHYNLAKESLLNKKHVFIEKPITSTVPEALELEKLAHRNNVKLQVGHIERFNPAFSAVSRLGLAPMFIEAHRLASFVPRGTDVSVILDIMIHDIDIVLKLIPSEIDNNKYVDKRH